MRRRTRYSCKLAALGEPEIDAEGGKRPVLLRSSGQPPSKEQMDEETGKKWDIGTPRKKQLIVEETGMEKEWDIGTPLNKEQMDEEIGKEWEWDTETPLSKDQIVEETGNGVGHRGSR